MATQQNENEGETSAPCTLKDELDEAKQELNAPVETPPTTTTDRLMSPGRGKVEG